MRNKQQKLADEIWAANEYLKDRRKCLAQELKAKKKDRVEIEFLHQCILEAKRDLAQYKLQQK